MFLSFSELWFSCELAIQTYSCSKELAAALSARIALYSACFITVLLLFGPAVFECLGTSPGERRGLLAGGFPRVLFPPLWCFPPAVSGWGSVWVGLTPLGDLASTGFHDCHQRTVRQPRPTRPRLATARAPACPITTPSDPAVPGRPPVQHQGLNGVGSLKAV